MSTVPFGVQQKKKTIITNCCGAGSKFLEKNASTFDAVRQIFEGRPTTTSRVRNTVRVVENSSDESSGCRRRGKRFLKTVRQRPTDRLIIQLYKAYQLIESRRVREGVRMFRKKKKKRSFGGRNISHGIKPSRVTHLLGRKPSSDSEIPETTTRPRRNDDTCSIRKFVLFIYSGIYDDRRIPSSFAIVTVRIRWPHGTIQQFAAGTTE